LERGEAIRGVALSAKEAMKRHGRVHSILTFLSAHRADLAAEERKTEQIQSLSRRAFAPRANRNIQGFAAEAIAIRAG
jgi:hypothetical protein